MVLNDPRNMSDEELERLIEETSGEPDWDDEDFGDNISFDTRGDIDDLEDLYGEEDL